MSFTVAQISDMHLSVRHEAFRANFTLVAAAVLAARPDHTVLSGDLSRDGAGEEADLAYAASCCWSLGPAWAVPGNHDVGEALHVPAQPVTAARLRRFRQHFGPDRWLVDHAGWRLLGLNSQVLGTGLEEEAQAGFIEEALATLGERRLAVFMHKPAFVRELAETEFAYWTVPPAARATLSSVLMHPALRLVASGHLHLRHTVQLGRVLHQWAPSVGFVVRPEDQGGLPGERVCGALLHRFEVDHVETTLLVPAGMACAVVHDGV